MTDRATRDHFLIADFIFGFQLRAFVSVEVIVLPLHIVDLGFWPDKFLWCAVTCQAPFHLQSILLINGGHIVDLPMAGRTSDAFCNVNAVIKVSVFGQIVDLFPLYRLVITITCPNELEIWAIRPYLAMTIHTRLR